MCVCVWGGGGGGGGGVHVVCVEFGQYVLVKMMKPVMLNVLRCRLTY